MLVPIYIVKMDGSYMNLFYSYGDACDLRENLERRFPYANVTIESDYYAE